MKNTLLKTALQFSKGMPENYPETVICGFAGLLHYDEQQVKNILKDDELIGELNRVRAVFEAKKLDLYLVRLGLVLLTPYVPMDRQDVKQSYDDFKRYIEETDDELDVIVSHAFDVSYMPIKLLCENGQTSAGLFSFLDKLKQVKDKSEGAEKNCSESEEGASEDNGADESTEKTDDTADNFNALINKYQSLMAELLANIKGQDRAVMKFVQGCYEGDVLEGAEKNDRPKSTFFFFGPPGVGKTFLAQTASEAMGIPYKVFNMAEYTHQDDNGDLVGISDYYKKAREGVLVEFVRQNPKCILVFDEIEKAHRNVIRIFLQMLGSGKVYNIFQKNDTDFSKTIVIFTSNAGKELYESTNTNLSTIPDSVLISALKSEKDAEGTVVFPPEICSRLASGTTIIFDHLKVRDLNGMICDRFDKTVVALENKYGYQVSYEKNLSKLFLYSRGMTLDARVASSQSENFIKSEIYELARQMNGLNEPDRSIRSIDFSVDLTGATEEIKNLFVESGTSKIMVYAEKSVSELLDGFDNVVATQSCDEANKILESDISAVFIDPYLGTQNDTDYPMSVADYTTDGVKLFHKIIESQSGIQVYILSVEKRMSDTDKRTFLEDGAANVIDVSASQKENFARQTRQVMEELYMEEQKSDFCQRGWVLDYRSKQIFSEEGDASVIFYDIRKKMALDPESRGTVLSSVDRPNVKFSDVIGAKNAKDELGYFISYLKNPKKFRMLGGKPPRGVLLYGPPGTGKTMLARAMAGESDVAFIQTSASEFMSKYVGGGEAKIRNIFKTARKYAPAIIFIDEIDAIGKKRTGSETTNATENMLTALFTEMDGFSSEANARKPVFVLAATNYSARRDYKGIADLDEAFMRRFDNKIYVDLPNKNERAEYISSVLSKKKVTNVDSGVIENIADRTAGQSLATLQNVIDLAFRNAVRAEHTMGKDDLLEALEENEHGEERESTPEYYREVAIHETGHAVMSYLQGECPSYITIESRSNFGGYMQNSSQEDVGSYTKDMLIGKIRTSLAGRAAEQIFYGKDKSLNTGASSDLEQATRCALCMVCLYGMMDGQLMVLKSDKIYDEILKSPLAPRYVDQINAILNEEMAYTVSELTKNKGYIEKVANELLAYNHLTGEEFAKLMEKQ